MHVSTALFRRVFIPVWPFFLLLHAHPAAAGLHENPYFYQISVYHYKTTGQERALDSFFSQVYLPALHRHGIASVGVFKPIESDTADRLVYLWIPLRTLDQWGTLEQALYDDEKYQFTGRAFLQAPYWRPPFNRLESILLKAFDGMLTPKIPRFQTPKKDRIYELRSYESPTFSMAKNKIGMFNDAEIELFSTLDFQALFYGEVISGSHMPNLMYITTFASKAARDLHWQAFGLEYKKISDLPRYQNNVTKYLIYFLHPAEYSDF